MENKYKCVHFKRRAKNYEARPYLDKKQHYAGTYPTDKQAAMAVDMFLIRNNQEPINVLKRVC